MYRLRWLRLRLRLRWSSPHMSLNQQYDFQKCQMSKYDFLPTWPWVGMRLRMSVFEICHSLSSKATGWHSRGHRLLRVALSEISGLGPKWAFATDIHRILTLARTGGGWCNPPPWGFSQIAKKRRRVAPSGFGVPDGANLAQLLVKKNWPCQVRSRSYDVIRGTTSGNFTNKSVFYRTLTWHHWCKW